MANKDFYANKFNRLLVIAPHKYKLLEEFLIKDINYKPAFDAL